MKKLIAIVLMAVMIGLPLQMAFARGGGGGGGGRAGGGAAAGRRGQTSDRVRTRRAARDSKDAARQRLRDRDEDKDTCRDNNRR